MSDPVYGLSLNVDGASTPAFYQVQLSSRVTLADGAAAVTPSSAAYTYVNFYEGITVQAPPGYVNGGIMVSTSDTSIRGIVMASPAVNVPVKVILQGAGTTLGEYALPAGQTSGQFTFDVNPSQAIQQSDVQSARDRLVPRKQ